MVASIRRFVFLLSLIPSFSAFAVTWTQPTPDELKMTSEPADPNAAAVYFIRDERADDKMHYHSLYVRLKILSDGGKKYADVEIPFEARHFSVWMCRGARFSLMARSFH